MIAGERLAALAGSIGTASSLLAMIGSGVTTGAALVNYSGLATGSASDHLLTDSSASVSNWLIPIRRRLRR